MSIAPVCDFCGDELTEPGALIFGPPPTVATASVVMKYHVCVVCFDQIKPGASIEASVAKYEDDAHMARVYAEAVERGDRAVRSYESKVDDLRRETLRSSRLREVIRRLWGAYEVETRADRNRRGMTEEQLMDGMFPSDEREVIMAATGRIAWQDIGMDELAGGDTQ